MPKPRIALATRELHPFVGGGIAPVVAAEARLLSGEVGKVTIFTTSGHREAYDRLASSGAPYGPDVRIVFVDEPVKGHPGFYSHMHAWSASLHQAITAHYGEPGPDLIEFGDYLAEGFVTIQARRTGDPCLRDTMVAIRAHTTAELCNVLNGGMHGDFPTRTIFEAERYCVRHADRLLHCGGDVLDTYVRFYGEEGVAPGARVADGFHLDFIPPETPDPVGEDGVALKVLYLGRLERRKGVQNLIRAAVRCIPDNWRLTLLGGDTDTAPLRTSMRDHLELASAGDPRVAFADPVAREEVGRVIAAHDLIVMPSLWECWPNVVREAFLHNRPVLATPVGGMVEMVEEGVSGWLTEDTSPDALVDGLERLIDDPERVRAVIAEGGPRAAFDRLSDAELTRTDYAGLLAEWGEAAPARRIPRPASPLVSVVIPYYRLDKHVGETVRSVRDQTYRNVEVVLVDDGSFREDDRLLLDLARERSITVVAQPNSGLGATRNFGISQARGRYVLPLDPDNVLEAGFVERCVEALEGDPDLAYVTSWSHYMDESGRLLDLPANGYTPYGNWTRMVDEQNLAGDGTALLRRWLFDLGFRYHPELTSYEDWFLYRELHHAGHLGAVIPERLFRYRVRDDSMLRSVGLVNNETIFEEMNAMMIENRTRWTPKSA